MDATWETTSRYDAFICNCCKEHYYTQCVDGYMQRASSGKVKKILCKYCMDYINSAQCGHCIGINDPSRCPLTSIEVASYKNSEPENES